MVSLEVMDMGETNKNGNIYLYTGANRARKSTRAMREAVNELHTYNAKTIIYVARTHNNISSMIETMKKYIPLSANIHTCIYAGRDKMCKTFIDYKKKVGCNDYNAKSVIICKKMCYKHADPDLNLKTAIRNLKTLTPETLNNLCFILPDSCTMQIMNMWVYQHKNNSIILTTYASYTNVLKCIGKNISDVIFIFDEARHIADMNVAYTAKLTLAPTKFNWEKIFEMYIDENIENNIEKHVDIIKGELNGKKMSDIMLENIYTYKKHVIALSTGYIQLHHLEKYVNKTFSKICLTDEEEKAWKFHALTVRKSQKTKEGFLEENYIKIQKPAYTITEKYMTELKKSLDIKNIESMKIYDFANMMLALRDKDNQLCFDLIDDEEKNKAVNLIIHNRKFREPYQFAFEGAKKTILVDSTPYPREYHKFWLGKDYDLKEHTEPPKYKYKNVVENRARAKSDIWRAKINSEREIQVEKGIIKKLSDEGVIGTNERKYHIFARSSKEKENIEDRLTKEICYQQVEIHYARGTSGEGVQLHGYVSIWGYPLQNICSDSYRKFEVAQAVRGHIHYAKNDIKKLRSIHANAELVQNAFRTADNENASGCILRHVINDKFIEIVNMFRWVKHENINQVILGRTEIGKMHLDVETRVKFLTEGLLKGSLPQYTATEQRIVDDVMNGVKEKNMCISEVKGNFNTVKRVVEKLIEEKKIIIENIEVISEKTHFKYHKKILKKVSCN